MVNNGRWFTRIGLYLFNRLQGVQALPPEKGCYNQLWAAAGAKRSEIVNGAYYTPIGVVGELDKLASSREFGEKLWTWTEELLNTAT
jgi:hypothetical protein